MEQYQKDEEKLGQEAYAKTLAACIEEEERKLGPFTPRKLGHLSLVEDLPEPPYDKPNIDALAA